MTFGIALIRFALFCVIVGIVLMIVGMAIPRRFRPDAFPFRPWRFETPEFFKRLRVSRPASLVFAPCEWTPLFILLYDIGNLPFIVIQRYNRPRMMKILRMREERERA